MLFENLNLPDNPGFIGKYFNREGVNNLGYIYSDPDFNKQITKVDLISYVTDEHKNFSQRREQSNFWIIKYNTSYWVIEVSPRNWNSDDVGEDQKDGKGRIINMYYIDILDKSKFSL